MYPIHTQWWWRIERKSCNCNIGHKLGWVSLGCDPRERPCYKSRIVFAILIFPEMSDQTSEATLMGPFAYHLLLYGWLDWLGTWFWFCPHLFLFIVLNFIFSCILTPTRKAIVKYSIIRSLLDSDDYRCFREIKTIENSELMWWSILVVFHEHNRGIPSVLSAK